MKDELTLQPAQSAYYVPGIVLGASGTSNKENNNVPSFKTQLPLKHSRVGFTQSPCVAPDPEASMGRGSAVSPGPALSRPVILGKPQSLCLFSRT